MTKDIETINVGIVGHIDHGKTTLLQRLTGKWTDSHSEELKRGITIRLGYADTTIYKDKESYNNEKKGEEIRHVSFVDAPGHEMLMATMLSGAAIIDAAILMVAANEGIKPQTREHLMALQAKNIPHLIVIQNKIDLVDINQAKENYKAIKELLKGKYEDSPIIPASAQQGINLDQIFKAISEMPVPKRNPKETPIFVIARSFDINKPGTTPEKLSGAVLGGSLKQGILKEGDEIEIKPGKLIKENNQYRYETITTKINKLFNGSEQVKELTPGGSHSIETNLDMSLAKADALGGNITSLKGKLPELTQEAKIKYTLFPEIYSQIGPQKVQAIQPSETLMLSINTSTTAGPVKKVKKDELEISLKLPIVASKGDNLGIARNINNHWRLIGYGEIL